ncbi:MAG: lipoyl(octanoyl) transferase LipB [Acidobacteria bacterium]|nr:lipoyl(octanoyl) transferase LipB [Acidobacteriota bacterium]
MPSNCHSTDLESQESKVLELGTAILPRQWESASHPSRPSKVYRMGLVPYREAWELQRSLVERRKAQEIEDTLLFLEHPPVITLGRNAKGEHVLSSPEVLEQAGIEIMETDRGGDVTYHGPGQLVCYLILDLGAIRRDVVWYVRTLEEAIIRTAKDFGLATERREGWPGVWVDQAKVAAIGIHISRWVTSHGFALNLETDLNFFQHIVPCGIAACPVTSFRQLLGKPVNRSMVEEHLMQHLDSLLGLETRGMLSEDLERRELCQPMC